MKMLLGIALAMALGTLGCDDEEDQTTITQGIAGDGGGDGDGDGDGEGDGEGEGEGEG